MITRRTTLKLLAVAASADSRHLSAEEAPADNPVPYFMNWPATDEIAEKLNQYRKDASCNQGAILLRRMFLIKPAADQKPEIVKTLPDVDGKFEVQLCLAFHITCRPDGDKNRVTSTITGPGLELLVSKGPPPKGISAGANETETQEFWHQAVENIVPDSPAVATEVTPLALELGLTMSAKFAMDQADSPPHTWQVVCFTGAWFSIQVKGKRMAAVEPLPMTAPLKAIVQFVNTSALGIP